MSDSVKMFMDFGDNSRTSNEDIGFWVSGDNVK